MLGQEAGQASGQSARASADRRRLRYRSGRDRAGCGKRPDTRDGERGNAEQSAAGRAAERTLESAFALLFHLVGFGIAVVAAVARALGNYREGTVGNSGLAKVAGGGFGFAVAVEHSGYEIIVHQKTPELTRLPRAGEENEILLPPFLVLTYSKASQGS
jgi:hypothetical protein